MFVSKYLVTLTEVLPELKAMKFDRFLALNDLFEQATRTFKRFPSVMLSAILAAAYAIYESEPSSKGYEYQLFMSLLLGLPLFLSMTFWRESKGLVSRKYQFLEFLFGACLLTGHYVLTAHMLEFRYMARYAQLSLALHLAVAFAAYTGDRGKNGFWQLNKTIFLRILFSALYAGVFYVGIVVALVTVDKLFSVEIPGHRYLQLWVLSALVFQTWHFLAGIPQDLRALENEQSYPRGLRIFVQYLLIPLVSLYMLILYCYMGKVLFERNWPSGYIGWLVSVMCVLGILNLLLIDPEKNREGRRWIAGYAKAFYILVLPLLAMLFFAVGERVAEYGMTEARYFLFVLGLYLAALCLYFIFSSRKNIKVVPVTLCLLALATSWGPWSVYNVSLRSQLSRARSILERTGLYTNGTIHKATKSITLRDEEQLSEIFRYLDAKHGSKTLREFFSTEQASDAETAMATLGLKFRTSSGVVDSVTFNFRSNYDKETHVIAGFEQIAFVDQSQAIRKFTVRGKTIEIELPKLGTRIVFTEAGKERARIELVPFLEQLRKTHGKEAEGVDEREMTFETDAGEIHFVVALRSIYATVVTGGKADVYAFNAVILAK